MFEHGPYLGIRRGGELLAVAGVHIWSPSYRVAAIGNVATHPRARGGGLASVAVAALCRRLLATVDRIALNVKADNSAALALYTRLGFTPVAEYTELTFTAYSVLDSEGAAVPSAAGPDSENLWPRWPNPISVVACLT